MKFGDKLILLRKKKGLSQEELAEKLGVSRQSVSKWESNNTYPETDKIVQICNLFECSMDDLINDKITNIEQIERVNKNTLNEAWDSLLDFITKTINMFSQMNFLNGMKCIIELIIVSFLLWVVGLIICNSASSIVSNLFSFLSNNTVNIIHNIVSSIFNCIWFILSIIILIHTFKLRYLNEYEQAETKNDNNNKNDTKEKEQVNNKVEISNVQNEKNQPFAFLGILSNIVIYFFKFIACWLSFGFTITIITLVFILFITIFMIPNHILFGGLSLVFLSSTVITSLLLLTCIYFVFSKKIPVKLYCIIFLVAIITFGLGAGISAVSVKNIEVIKENKIKEEQIDLDYQEDMVIYSHPDSKYQYIIDSNMEEGKIKVLTNINSRFESIKTNNKNEDQMNVYDINYEIDEKLKDLYKEFVNNLKENKVVLPEDSNHSVRIYANENTIRKLIDNSKKLYLIEEEAIDNNITITIHDSKVYFPNGGSEIYDARNDTLILDDDEQCERSIQSTKWGDRIIYTCNEKEDYDDE